MEKVSKSVQSMVSGKTVFGTQFEGDLVLGSVGTHIPTKVRSGVSFLMNISDVLH